MAGVVAGLAVGPLGGPAARAGDRPAGRGKRAIHHFCPEQGCSAWMTAPALSPRLECRRRSDSCAWAFSLTERRARDGSRSGRESYLGVTGQGVTGLLAARGFQSDFPGQIQAQVIGIAGLSLWGFFCASLICAPLGIVFKGIERAMQDGEPVVEQPAVEEQPRRERSRPWREAAPQAPSEGGSIAQEMAAPRVAEMAADEPRFS